MRDGLVALLVSYPLCALLHRLYAWADRRTPLRELAAERRAHVAQRETRRRTSIAHRLSGAAGAAIAGGARDIGANSGAPQSIALDATLAGVAIDQLGAPSRKQRGVGVDGKGAAASWSELARPTGASWGESTWARDGKGLLYVCPPLVGHATHRRRSLFKHGGGTSAGAMLRAFADSRARLSLIHI